MSRPAHAPPGAAATTSSPMQSLENQGKTRLLLTVSPTHKHLAMRAFAVQQVATWIAVISLAAVHTFDPVLAPELVWYWLAVFLASWVLRLLIFVPLYKYPPAVVAQSLMLKSLPFLSSIIGCSFWIWTTTLFLGPSLTMREVILFTGFLSMSISMTGMWPVTPITSMAYYVALWSAFSYALWVHGIVTPVSLVALNASVVAMIWLNVFVSIMQVKSQLARGVELDQALYDLWKANAELEALKDSACRTLETRSEFFSEASHDFRQRLHAAKLWVSSVKDAAGDIPVLAWPLKRLGHELNALQTYIDRVLDFARMEALDTGIQLQSTSIQSLFQKLDLSFEKVTAHDGKSLRFRRTPLVLGTDASMLLRILENLVSNALKYTRDGVLVCARRRGAFLALQVWDQGPGIKQEAHQRIFEAFHQEDDAGGEAPHEKGIGLGLAIVKRFADRLGYTLEVRASAGRGTVFTVLIPAELAETVDVTSG